MRDSSKKKLIMNRARRLTNGIIAHVILEHGQLKVTKSFSDFQIVLK